MKRKLIILVSAAIVFSCLVNFTLVRAQTTESEPTSDTSSVLKNIVQAIFKDSDSNQWSWIKTVDDLRKAYDQLNGVEVAPTSAPGIAGTGTPTLSATPGPSPTAGPSPVPDPNSKCNTAAKGYGACKLVEEIQRVCGGTVNSGNIGCLNNIRIPGKADNFLAPAIEDAVKLTGSDGLQCVVFVKMALYIMSNGDGDMLSPRGNPPNWMSDPPNGYYAITRGGSQKIQDGDVLIWDFTTYGHIAVSIGNSIIAEGNFDTHGKVNNERPIREDDPGLVGWLRHK